MITKQDKQNLTVTPKNSHIQIHVSSPILGTKCQSLYTTRGEARIMFDKILLT